MFKKIKAIFTICLALMLALPTQAFADTQENTVKGWVHIRNKSGEYLGTNLVWVDSESKVRWDTDGLKEYLEILADGSISPNSSNRRIVDLGGNWNATEDTGDTALAEPFNSCTQAQSNLNICNLILDICSEHPTRSIYDGMSYSDVLYLVVPSMLAGRPGDAADHTGVSGVDFSALKDIKTESSQVDGISPMQKKCVLNLRSKLQVLKDNNILDSSSDAYMNYKETTIKPNILIDAWKASNTDSSTRIMFLSYINEMLETGIVDTSEQDNKADGEEVESSEAAADKFDNWYKAAYKVATGADNIGDLGDEYLAAANIKDIIKDDSEWRTVYDIMCLAYSRGEDKTTEWDPDKAMLNESHKECKKEANGAGLDPQGVSRYPTIVDKLNKLSMSSTDLTTKRMSSFYDRLIGLYHLSTAVDVDLDNEAYSWLKEYYDGSAEQVFIPSSLMTNDSKIGPFLSFDGTTIKDFPRLDKEPMIMVYFMRTIWELPYLTEYMAPTLNDAINNSTIAESGVVWEGLKGIKQAVDEFGSPVLKTLWELPCEKYPELDYKSLKDMYEACMKDPKIQDQLNEAPVELTNGKPLSEFFEDYSAGKLSNNYLKAIAYTSTLVPMRSNVYSSEWRSYLDDELKSQFYDLWGFNRKALYMDRTAGAGEEYYTSGKTSKGDIRVCTLRDLLDSNGEIVLYLDDNFYNAQQLKENSHVNPEYKGESSETEQTQSIDENPWFYNMSMSLEEAFNSSFTNIVKTGSSVNYSKTFFDMMTRVNGSHTYYPEATVEHPGNNDSIVLSSGKINYYLKPGQTGSEIYTPLQSYAVVSSIYRDGELFNLANSKLKNQPVFVSSKTAPYAKGASLEQKMVIFNYALMKNLKAAMPVGYTGSLDMDCPIYMDILGNIVTESGTVVIPALSNATIMNHSTYFKSLWSAGLFSVYGMDYTIPVKSSDAETIGPVIDGIFEPDKSGKHYIATPRTLGDQFAVDMSRLSSMSRDTISILFERSYADLVNTQNSIEPLYDFDSYFQICLEVMRGAPIENIDKEAEGLDTSSRVDRAGIVAAAKLEELNESLGTNGENTTLALPSIAFMPGFSYVALIAFKLILLIVIVINMVTIYYDTVSETLSVGTFVKCIWAMVLTMVLIVTVPAVFDITYYQSNRALLQEETSYISMLNLEKEESGVEIGVTEVREPNTKTELFLKLEDIDIPWYDLFYNSVHSSSYKDLNEMYTTYAEDHSNIAYRDDVTTKNDGVYISVDDIFKSSAVDVNMSSSDANKVTLVQTARDKTATFSYFSPYYAILDALINNVNYFNAHPWTEGDQDTQGWYSYTTKTQKGGKLKTMGLIEPYFTSSKFMEDDRKDPLGLKAIYSGMTQYDYLPDEATVGLYTAQNVEFMKKSYWYPDGMSNVEIEKRIAYLTKEARTFVANNKDLLGKISDETFLKVMALDLSLKHNRILGCEYASAYEINNLSSDDLIRLSVADRSSVMLNSSLSYPRFVYAVGGTPAVFAAALLSMIVWVSSLVKPILVIVAFLTIFVSVFVFKICKKKHDTSLYGYLITVLLLCGTNFLYAIILKLSLYLPTIGMTPFMCLLIQIVVQIVYLMILLNVVGTAFRDWKDLGFAKYVNKSRDIKINLMAKMHKNRGVGDPNFEGSTRTSTPEKNWEIYDNMLDERSRRNK